jgi:hypothetical protein
MAVKKFPDGFSGIYLGRPVQGHAEFNGRVQPLEDVHVIGEGYASEGLTRHMIIPGGPAFPVPGQEACVGVKVCQVFLIGKRGKHLSLRIRGVGEEGKSFVAVHS